MRYFSSEVMEMCHREGLYQIDLLNGGQGAGTKAGKSPERLEKAKGTVGTAAQDRIQRMADIGQKMAEGKGGGYAYWAKQFNLQQMSQTMLYLEKYGFQNPKEVEEALQGTICSERDKVQQIRGKERQIAENKELMRHAENYRRTKPAYDGLKKIKRAKRRVEYEEENERLILEKNGLYEELREKRAKTGELQSMKANLDTMLRRERQAHKELDVFL